ncbi:MAG: hypothetical protein LBT15_06785, partial [Synergistaceae bacterium]|nr:hypothetical protein [Synergistaceae bacterium]
LSDSVVVEEGAEIVDSVLMPNVYVGKNAKVYRTIIGPNSKIMNGAEVGSESGICGFVSDRFCTNGISVIAPWAYIARNTKLRKNSYIEGGVFLDGFLPGRHAFRPEARGIARRHVKKMLFDTRNFRPRGPDEIPKVRWPFGEA